MTSNSIMVEWRWSDCLREFLLKKKFLPLWGLILILIQVDLSSRKFLCWRFVFTEMKFYIVHIFELSQFHLLFYFLSLLCYVLWTRFLQIKACSTCKFAYIFSKTVVTYHLNFLIELEANNQVICKLKIIHSFIFLLEMKYFNFQYY